MCRHVRFVALQFVLAKMVQSDRWGESDTSEKAAFVHWVGENGTLFKAQTACAKANGNIPSSAAWGMAGALLSVWCASGWMSRQILASSAHHLSALPSFTLSCHNVSA